MRIWHKELIPHLCSKHLVACWREGLGAFKIITENKKGYSNHPATLEWKHAPYALLEHLSLVRSEMIKRGMKPKSLPADSKLFIQLLKYKDLETIKEWQTLEQQIEIIKQKNCDYTV